MPEHAPEHVREADPKHLLDQLEELEAAGPRQRHRKAWLLMLLPIAAVIYPPLYNRDAPTLIGVPFFVWYQMAAVIFGGMITGIVYLIVGTERNLTRDSR